MRRIVLDYDDENSSSVRVDSDFLIISRGDVDVLFISEGGVGIGGRPAGDSPFSVAKLPVFPDNASAIDGNLLPGNFYRTGADPDQLCIVHEAEAEAEAESE